MGCRLPLKRVLTLNLEVPESWLVEPVMALHDLDNLRLADIPEQASIISGIKIVTDHQQAALPAVPSQYWSTIVAAQPPADKTGCTALFPASRGRSNHTGHGS